MKERAIILVSGGIDSSTVLAIALEQGYEIHALSFDYQQRHSVELMKVKELIKGFPVASHKIMKLDLRSFGGSALTDDAIDVPKYGDADDLGDDIPVTYVPARNTIFLSYALAYAEVTESNNIFIGVHVDDYSNYPDCRPEYIEAFEAMANLATSAATRGNRLKIHAPLIGFTKTQIVAEGLKRNVDYSKTISCYDPTPEGLSCGTCHPCLLRLRAFEMNDTKDPALYKSN
ncbi:MAG: 7-cyano-7-deazaguanine synthase QueC [Pseudomonadota bacterium]